MMIIVVDQNGHLIFTFDDTEYNRTSIEEAYENIKLASIKPNDVFKDNLYILKEYNNRKYHFFFKDVRNVKEANYRARILIKGINDFEKIGSVNEELSDYIARSISHNTRNIVHYLSNGLKKAIKYEDLILENDKVNFLRNLIIEDPIKYSRELLNASKSLEQVSFEYNIIDYLNPGAKILESDKTSVRIHSMLVQAIYIYEHQLVEKAIKIKISEDYSKIRGNFFTLRSAFALIIENCCKYCKNSTDIEIEINHLPTKIKIDITMKSIFNTNIEIEKMFLPKARGEEAIKVGQGSGLGLFIVKQLLHLNDIEIYFKRINDSISIYNGIKYSNNMFIIDIPIDIVIEERKIQPIITKA